MGWGQRFLFPTSPSKPIIIYHDILSHSLTFRQPTFSLYEDRRLALGSRRFSASGQTYYLDILRFTSPASCPLRQPVSAGSDNIFKNDHLDVWLPTRRQYSKCISEDLISANLLSRADADSSVSHNAIGTPSPPSICNIAQRPSQYLIPDTVHPHIPTS